MDVTTEIERMRKEAVKELLSNFEKLNMENGARLVMYSRKLAEEEHSDSLRDRALRNFDRLNIEGKKLALAYVEALAANPKYRKSFRREAGGRDIK